MKLTDLDAKFLKLESERVHAFVEDIKDADGVRFLCPVCFINNGNTSEGTHMMECWRPHVPQSNSLSGPGRWEFVGSGLDDLTLVAGSSSILINGGCNAHFWIRNGEIIFC